MGFIKKLLVSASHADGTAGVQKRTDARAIADYVSAQGDSVLSTIIILLILLWLLGIGTSYTLGGLIHVLLVIAVVVVLVRVIQGRNPLRG
jgi:hypothetical protein